MKIIFAGRHYHSYTSEQEEPNAVIGVWGEQLGQGMLEGFVRAVHVGTPKQEPEYDLIWKNGGKTIQDKKGYYLTVINIIHTYIKIK